MNAEAEEWLKFAKANLRMANLAFADGLFRQCLENVGQSVEKSLKAVLVYRGEVPPRTHSIGKLYASVRASGTEIQLSPEECDFLTSVYAPSRYPLGKNMPEFNPEEVLCRDALLKAGRTLAQATAIVAG